MRLVIGEQPRDHVVRPSDRSGVSPLHQDGIDFFLLLVQLDAALDATVFFICAFNRCLHSLSVLCWLFVMAPPPSKKFHLFGYPIAHSAAPALHNHCFRSLGTESTYTIWSTSKVTEEMLAVIHNEDCGGAA
jgi:hypothetical protein